MKRFLLNAPILSFLGLFWLLGLFLLPLATANTPDTETITTHTLKGHLSKTTPLELDLRSALEMAKGDNPTYKASEAITKQARHRYHRRLAELLPDIDVSFQQSNYNGALQIFGNTVVNVDREIRQPQLVFSFPVFQGGRRFLTARSAKRELKAYQATEEATLQQVLRHTALRYYDLKRHLGNITIAEKQLAQATEQVNLNQARFDSGTGTRLDLLQAKAHHAQAKQQLLESLKGSEIAALHLNELLNLPAIADVTPLNQSKQPKALLPDTVTFDMMRLTAIENRPELEALTRNVAALKSLRLAIFSAALPNVDLNLRTGGLGPRLNQTRSFDDTSIAITMSFDNLFLSAITRYKESGAKEKELLAQLKAKQNEIDRELGKAHLEVISKRQQIEAARLHLEASELAASDALERFKAGIGRNIDVLDAQTQLSKARSNLNTTLLQYNQAQVNLVYHLGLASVESLTQGVTLP